LQLTDFIHRDMEAILAEWEKFASAQLPAAAHMSSLALRDHAEHVLRAVAKDIATAQTLEEQADKSKSRAPRLDKAVETAAETHALLRAQSGFNINQLTAEYRALRASVLHLWAQACNPAAIDLQDMVRFNEAIDQAISESVAFFTAQMDNERNLLLAVLGHDMRSPLQVIHITAKHLSKLDAGIEVATAAARLFKSSADLNALFDDLSDFNRTKLGLGIKIAPSAVNLADAFAAEFAQLRVAYPGRTIELQTNGDVSGVWDAHRLHQLLGNLVGNAFKYGAVNEPVRVVLTGMPAEVVFSVHNRGPVIDESTLTQIFKPLKRGPEHQSGPGGDDSLGLGLFIAREIVIAHGGDISVKSDEAETVFTVRLPRLSGGCQTRKG
jgi:signal transduction histidine kinase